MSYQSGLSVGFLTTGPVCWGWTSSIFCCLWPLPSFPPKGWCAVRVTLVAIPLKTVPGLVHLPIAQPRGCLPATLCCWEMPVIAPLPFDLLELFRTVLLITAHLSQGKRGWFNHSHLPHPSWGCSSRSLGGGTHTHTPHLPSAPLALGCSSSSWSLP